MCIIKIVEVFYMKYFLAVDKGSFFSNKERFKRINLSSLNDLLASDNNLEALCTFTSTFSSLAELKSFLTSQKLLEPRLSIYDLTIVYFKDFNKSMEIVYVCDANYFNLEYLKQAIYNQALNPMFIKNFIEQYHNYKKVSEEIRALKVFYANIYPDSKILYRVISSFIEKLCLEDSADKPTKNYLELYKLAMFVSRQSNPHRDQIIHEPIKKEIEEKNDINFPELKEPEEEQIRWF